jgi:hypothetical protein
MEEDPPPQKLKLGEARFENVNQARNDGTDEAPVDVHQILQSNLRSTVPGEKPLDLTKKLSRRKKDYWISMLAANLLYLTLYFVVPRNIISMLFIFSGVIVTNIGLAWVLLFIMDD